MTDEELAAEINKLILSFMGKPANDALNVLCNAMVCIAKKIGIERAEFVKIVGAIYDKCTPVKDGRES